MKKLLLLFALTCACQAEPLLVIDDLSQGKVDHYDATRIPNNSVYDCRNVWFDGEYPAEKRSGMTKLNSTAVGGGSAVLSQFEYKMSDGTRYHILHSGTSVYYRLSGSDFTVLKNDASSTYPANYCVFIDTLTVVDGVNNMWSWDTSSTFTQESTYQPRFIIVWQNRIWIAGDSDERSKVRCSEWLDPSDYTVPASPVYTDPAVFDINSQDGTKVMGFFLSPNGGLGILKENSVWEIQGYDRSDFYLRLVIPDIGCIDSGSVATKEGVVSWLSTEGFIGYDGHTFSIISGNIQGTIDEIDIREGIGDFTIDTKAQWDVYSSTENIDTDTIVGSIRIDIDIESDYSSIGQFSNLEVDTSDYFRYVDLLSNVSLVDVNYINGIFGTATIENSGMITIPEGTNHWFALDSNNYKSCVYFSYTGSPSVYSLKYASASFSSGWSTSTIKNNIMNYDLYSTASVDFDTSNNPHVIFSSGTTVTGYDLRYSSHNGTSWSSNIIIDTLHNGVDTLHCGIIKISGDDKIHIVYATKNSNVVKYASATTMGLTSFSTSTISNAHSISCKLGLDYNSSNNPYISYMNGTDLYISSHTGTTWINTKIIDASELSGVTALGDSEIKLDSSDNILVISIANTNDIYGRKYNNTSKKWNDIAGVQTSKHMISINYDSADYPIGLCGYFGEEVDIIPSTATFISTVYDTGITGTMYMDEFYATQTTADQNIYHYIRSSDTATNVLGESWTAMTSGSIPSITEAQFIQYKCIISSNILSTNFSTIDDIEINYHSASGTVFLSSMHYDSCIWNAVSISSATYLDRQLIWDTNNVWTDFTSAVGCRSLYNYNGTPYWGSNDGYVYVMDTGNIDGTHPIESWVLTKNYSMGSMIQEKTLDKLYVLADDSGDWNLSLDYYLDRSGTATNSFDIDLDQTSDFINYKVPLNKTKRFYTLQFKVYNNNANEPWSLLGIHAFGRVQPLR